MGKARQEPDGAYLRMYDLESPLRVGGDGDKVGVRKDELAELHRGGRRSELLHATDGEFVRQRFQQGRGC